LYLALTTAAFIAHLREGYGRASSSFVVRRLSFVA
jgi:hypothetical protein